MSVKEMTLGDRMKKYENTFKMTMPIRLPVAIRIDGRSFHTLSRKWDKPFDLDAHNAMVQTTIAVCSDAQNAVLGYTQSDEISVLLINYKDLTTESWFGNEIQKIVSSSASTATHEFTKYSYKSNIVKLQGSTKFDSRVWVLPKEEVCNYFLWRQQDCEKKFCCKFGKIDIFCKNSSW